jgi:Protein of unknown function (DUF2970)
VSGAPAMSEPHDESTLRAAVARKGSFGQTMKAVAWSFFGIRKSAEYEKDVNQLNPVHVIVAGIIGAALFVVALVLLVHWVTSSGVAGGG